MSTARPLRKILILALGGEGGGTLTEWVVEAGLASQWPIQATSIPGVAQRTGATSYYIECLPEVLAPGDRAPPMCLAPLAGDLDLIISSELLETARAVERGLADRQRTVIVSSTVRALTVDERTAMAEGRLSSVKLEASLKDGARELCLFDMNALARKEGTIVSAVMFGALVGSGVLPLARERCEAVIAQGAAASALSAREQASLRGFAAGFDAVGKGRSWAESRAEVRAEVRAEEKSDVKGDDAIATDLPKHPSRAQSFEEVLSLGIARCKDFQDEAYAHEYSAHAQSLHALDQPPFAASTEAARSLALWMAYEDVIRVADLKSRRSRFEQIRAEYKAKPEEPVIVRDFLKPGVDEIAAILPPLLANPFLAWARGRKLHSLGEGVQMSTSSITGLLSMRLLSGLRVLRRRSSRFGQEQALIARWLGCMQQAFALERTLTGAPGQTLSSPGLALAVARLPGLIKGYSDTFARGRGNFQHILERLLEPALVEAGAEAKAAPAHPGVSALAEKVTLLVARLEEARRTALANPDGVELYRALGLEPRQREPLVVKEQVINFARPIRRSRQ